MSNRRLLLLLVAPACVLVLFVLSTLHVLQGRAMSTATWATHAWQDGARGALASQLSAELLRVQQLRQNLERQSQAAGAGFPDRWTNVAPAVGQQANNTDPLANISRNATLFVSFSNAHYSDFLLNWSAHLKKLQAAHIVVPFDEETASLCREHGIMLMPFDTQFESANMRTNGTKFRKLATQKPRIVQRLFRAYGFETLILSDTDTVWLRHPSDYIAKHPLADLFISTDCGSHQAEVDQVKNTPRCGHIAGSTCCNAYNTGIIVLRNTAATLDIMAAWHDRLAYPDGKDAAQDEKYLSQKYRIGDQVMLNEIILRGGHQPIVPLAEDPSLSRGFDSKVRIHFLPALQFANGYVAFIQQLPARHSVLPYVVHATFQRDENPGKLSRFREWGWWLMDPPGYFMDGNFMSYANGVRGYIDGVTASYKRGYMARFHQHQLAASYQLAAFQHALAIARALNRTLILPQFWCWCDQDADAQVLRDCTSAGTDLELPFRCPADHLIIFSKLQQSGASLRHCSFLQQPQVPAAVIRSVAPVELHGPDEALPAQNYASQFGAHVRAGMTDRQLKAAVAPWKDIRVLHWRNFEPGAFGGYEDPSATADFDRIHNPLTQYQGWCCSGGYWVDKFELVNWPYQRPPDLAQQSAASGPKGVWTPPVALSQRPDFCDKLKPDNQKFTLLTNHPCKYLTDFEYGPVTSSIKH